MSVNHAPEPDDTLGDVAADDELGDELDDESTEGHGLRAFEHGDADASINRDIDPQSSRPQ